MKQKIFQSITLLIVYMLAATVTAAAQEEAARLSHPNRAEAKKLDEASCADGFSFAVLGDIHQKWAVTDGLFEMIRELKPDFAVAIGDFTNDGHDDEYSAYLEHITALETPWFSVPGNHEYRDPNGHTSPDGKKRFERIFGDADFAFEYCGWRFVLLDVVAYDMLMPAQLKRLERALAGSGGRAAVFMHYPPAIVDKWEDGIWRSGAEEMMRLLQKYETRYFFAGHIHVHDSLKIGKTTYIVTGGGGGGVDSTRTPDTLHSPDAGPFHHFIIVEVNGSAASYKIMRPESE